MITPKELKEQLNYDKFTGVFTWKHSKSGNKGAGSVAGNIDKNGYTKIVVNGKDYKAHRLAWLYMHGDFPDMLDHINGVRTDNSIFNLRECNKSQNAYNQKLRSDTISGVKGVGWYKRTGKWRVRIYIDGIRKCFGYYDDLDAAKDIINKIRSKHHKEFANHG